ncbi:MAG TPA: metallophosphoesterase family protein [Actinomycetota bacterium]|nr:metallophosphoesterase family protein [Actinomycetota bacterium]
METPFGEVPERYLERASMAEIDERLRRGRVSRRAILKAGVLGAGAIAAGPVLWQRPGFAAVPPAGRHLVFGSDPQRTMTVSWSTESPVQNPVLDIGIDDSYGTALPAETRTVAGTPTQYHHVPVVGLQPGTTYHYRVRHDGDVSDDSTFRTAPASIGAFTFTAFGDQGVSDGALQTTQTVAAANPAFHFHTGDLCYAFRTGTGNPLKPAPPIDILVPILTDQSVWDEWLALVTPQAARAPWMTTVGNHEMEYGYGELGYDSYLSRFVLPGNGAAGAPSTYSFRYGNVAVLALDGNDVSYELSANRGYTGGAQDLWLEQTLAMLRTDPTIDFIVAGYHNCSYCTNVVHASDAGPRERWGDLFDRYSVDLVINGHNHCYERTHPLRAGKVTREAPAGSTISAAADGTTYITAGGGGQAAYQVALYPASYVTILGGLRVPELAPWSATRFLNLSLLVIDVEPPDPHGIARMTVRAVRADGTEIERITLTR